VRIYVKFSSEEKSFLLSLARKAIALCLESGRKLELKEKEIPAHAKEKGACFVTLKINGQLRGCIGSLEAWRPLSSDVVENALSAAFADPRFYPLEKSEFQKIKVSISVLSEPEALPVKDFRDLLKNLIPGKHGLVIRKGSKGATFLPVVWEELPEKEAFLSNLCAKAGLKPEEWKEEGMKFFTYEAQEFSE
jgi:AmmeMemoRadiSam system protein A